MCSGPTPALSTPFLQGTTAARTKYLPITEAMLETFPPSRPRLRCSIPPASATPGMFRGRHLFGRRNPAFSHRRIAALRRLRRRLERRQPRSISRIGRETPLRTGRRHRPDRRLAERNAPPSPHAPPPRASPCSPGIPELGPRSSPRRSANGRPRAKPARARSSKASGPISSASSTAACPSPRLPTEASRPRSARPVDFREVTRLGSLYRRPGFGGSRRPAPDDRRGCLL